MNPETENKPTIDRATLYPILLGVFSIFGILLVFMIGRYNASRPPLPPEDTATPFTYQLIGTEPGISTAEDLTNEPGTPDGTSEGPILGGLGDFVTAQQGGSSGSGSSSDNATEEETFSSEDGLETPATVGTNPIIVLNPGSRTATQSFGIIVRTSTSSRTPGPTITITPSRTRNVTSTSGSSVTNTPSYTPTASRTPTIPPTGATQVPLAPGTYDDSHPLIAYNGWSSITEPSAYQSTLHVSTTTGSFLTFRFTGQQIRLTFQGGASFGEILINIGGLNFALNESNGTDEWVSAQLAQGTYIVTITHSGGGSVNIDSIIIPDFNTPTPTATPTPTSN